MKLALSEKLRALDAWCEGRGVSLRRDALMRDCTTLRLGGAVDRLYEASDMETLRALLTEARRLELPTEIIGRGSNLLALDGGVRGLVVRIGPGLSLVNFLPDGRVEAEAGVSLSSLARMAAVRGMEGLAFAGGIPGSLGGGAVMNAGAYGGELAQVITAVEGFRLDGTPFRYGAEELAYGYRASRLQREPCAVTRVELRLRAGDRQRILEEMAELQRKRAEKQPLTLPSAGSTFKRPPNGFAAALIDQCGLKGLRVGGAQVSEKHAGFLVNLGGTSEDFTALMRRVQETVLRETGVALEPEVRVIGEEKK